MLRILQILAREARKYGPAVVPVLAAVAVALPAAYQAVESVGVPSTTTGWTTYISWSHYAPAWLGKGIPIAVMTGGTAFVAGWIAWRHKVAANMAAVSGTVAVAVLTWATQWCNAVGGITVGAVIAGMIIAVAAVARAQSEGGY